jgi:hypothetical protein
VIDFVTTYIGVNTVLFFAVGVVGILAHIAKKLLQEEIDSSILCYAVFVKPGHTIGVLISLVAAAFAANAVGGLEELRITTVVAAGFTSGWTIDSITNMKRASA